ncbi:MAG: hypothetical protein ACLUMK_04725 [Christensenellales bacterium]
MNKAIDGVIQEKPLNQAAVDAMANRAHAAEKPVKMAAASQTGDDSTLSCGRRFCSSAARHLHDDGGQRRITKKILHKNAAHDTPAF